jgi:iron complex transport system ATP-binding protein
MYRRTGVPCVVVTPESLAMNTLVVEHCCVRYGKKTVVDDVSLHAQPGAFIAVIGPNGAGKSTLLRAIAGLVPLVSGTIAVDGTSITALSPQQRAHRIAMVPQQTHMPTGFSVREVVAMARYAFRPWYVAQKAEDEAIIDAALRDCEIIEYADSAAAHLSGGEQQRVAVARAIAQQTNVLILDEPTAHLDLHHQAAILRIAQVLSQRGVLVIAAMHDLNLAAASASHILLLHHGRTVAQGTPVEVLQQAVLERVYRTSLLCIPHGDAAIPFFVLDHAPQTCSAPS